MYFVMEASYFPDWKSLLASVLEDSAWVRSDSVTVSFRSELLGVSVGVGVEVESSDAIMVIFMIV